MTEQNTIPVTDVTDEAAWNEAHAKASACVVDGLALNRPFVHIGLADDGVKVTCLADQEGLQYALLGILTTLGDELLGERGRNLPPAAAQSIKLATGLAHIAKRVQTMVGAPQTPTSDIGTGAGINGADIPEPPPAPVH